MIMKPTARKFRAPRATGRATAPRAILGASIADGKRSI
jgi:hypothetical protein